MSEPGNGVRDDQDWLRLPAWLGIEAELGQVPDHLADAERPRPWVYVTPEQVLVRFGDGPRILVTSGRHVTVHLPRTAEAVDSPPGHAAWLVDSWAILIALLQRGDLSLHATTVEIRGEPGARVVAIAGSRGVGKSTTAMALRRAGHRLLVDDVTLLEFRDGQAWTTPFPRSVHLLADAAEAAGVDFDAHPPLAWVPSKASVRIEAAPERPHRLDRIVVLVPDSGATAVSITRLTGFARVWALDAHVRRDGVAPLILGEHRYFELLARLARTVPVWELRRPADAWSLHEVVALLAGQPADPREGRDAAGTASDG